MVELRSEVAAAAVELGVPGVAIGVDHAGRREIVVHGVSAVDHGRPIGPETLFQLGSTAKTFTAAVIMVLVDQGRVDLDQRVRRHLPELRLADDHAAETVTVGHLLNHTAGWDSGDSWTDTGEGDDALERAATLVAELPQQFVPGTAASYNNAAFVLAGRLIERVTGQTYERALTDLLLRPLGLSSTKTSLNEIMTGPYAIGHEQTGDAGFHCDALLRLVEQQAAESASPVRMQDVEVGDLGDARFTEGRIRGLPDDQAVSGRALVPSRDQHVDPAGSPLLEIVLEERGRLGPVAERVSETGDVGGLRIRHGEVGHAVTIRRLR